MLKIGSVATGYGGLDAAVAAAFGAELAWVADSDPEVARILAHWFPGVPNLGDITKLNWAQVLAAYGAIDIFCAGFPCQDVSAAGLRAGIQPGNRSGLWFHIVKALRVLRPEIVVLENVRGLLTAPAHSGMELCDICMGNSPARRLRALGAVLGNLADLGFDAEWQIVSAADAGSCHRRERVFILAWDRSAADAHDDQPDERAGAVRTADGRPAAGRGLVRA